MDALGEATRRSIVAVLQHGPQTVGELAAGLPVGRPAVSQHLKVLAAAGLVEVERHGTRRLYRLAPAGLDAVRVEVTRFWMAALAALQRETRSTFDHDPDDVDSDVDSVDDGANDGDDEPEASP